MHRHPSPSHQRFLLLALGTCLFAGVSCGEGAPERPTTLARYPHAMDRLARLMRAQFASADPAKVEQEIRCETARVQRTLGADFPIRQRFLLDSLHEEFAAEQFNELGQRLARSATPSADAPACRAINEAAAREVPLTAATVSPDSSGRAVPSP